MSYLWEGRWANALAAAVLDALLVRPSRRTLEAALAARAEVTFPLLDFGMIPSPFNNMFKLYYI